MNTPRFSILIPARDEEKYLPGCLESITVAAKPFPDQVEIIVALNRCTDRTEAIGGFNESYVSVEDLDFAKRLKAYGRSKGKRFKTVTKAHIVTSCRKFDIFGEWFLVRNLGTVRRIFAGQSQADADNFFYDIKR